MERYSKFQIRILELIIDTPMSLDSLSDIMKYNPGEIDRELADMFGKGMNIEIATLDGVCYYYFTTEDKKNGTGKGDRPQRRPDPDISPEAP
jgi:hypothetical protein